MSKGMDLKDLLSDACKRDAAADPVRFAQPGRH